MVSCEDCGGPLPGKPYVWTCWSDAVHDFTDHQFCSGVCRDRWLERRLLARCHKCGKSVDPDEVTFRYCDLDRKSLPFHKDCC